MHFNFIHKRKYSHTKCLAAWEEEVVVEIAVDQEVFLEVLDDETEVIGEIGIAIGIGIAMDRNNNSSSNNRINIIEMKMK